MCVCVFISSTVRVSTFLMEFLGTPIRASFFEFKLKPTGKDSAAYVLSFSLLLCLEPCKKFLVGGGGWWWFTVNLAFCFGPKL